MSNLSIFAFEGQQVRFVGTAENPGWVACDVFAVLGVKWDGHNLDSYLAPGNSNVNSMTKCQRSKAFNIE